MSMSSVTVVGASGNVGPVIIDALLATKKFTVSAFIRQESKSTFPSEVNVVKGDYTQSSLEKALKGQDAVICTIGIGGFHVQKVVVDAAIAAGVKRFFPSDFVTDVTEKTIAFAPLSKDKQDVIDYLISKEDYISWTVIKTSAFFDWGLKVGFIGFDLANHKVELLDGGVTKFHATNLSNIAGAVTRILAIPETYEKTKNQIVSIPNHEVSQRDILTAIERITGETWEVTDADSDTLVKNARGSPAEAGALIRALIFGKAGLGRLNGKLWNDELGLSQKSLEEDLKVILDGKSP
ncbi:isoflavone reductase [Flagelloscypha sp. PMI_526]|nr:isoflavone reductase [Flagelloscypha sp. PMI_526]